MKFMHVILPDGRQVTFDERGYFDHCSNLPPDDPDVEPREHGCPPAVPVRETCRVPGTMPAILHAFLNGHVTVDEGEQLIRAYALRKGHLNVGLGQ